MLNTLKLKLLSLHKSFTNWFNAVGAVALQSLLSYPELTTYLSTKGLFWIIIVGNVFIRVFKTTSAIEAK
ncbi:MAG: hypothetical protein OCD76_07430 [Reichenbachiella sp.]